MFGDFLSFHVCNIRLWQKNRVTRWSFWRRSLRCSFFASLPRLSFVWFWPLSEVLCSRILEKEKNTFYHISHIVLNDFDDISASHLERIADIELFVEFWFHILLNFAPLLVWDFLRTLAERKRRKKFSLFEYCWKTSLTIRSFCR